MSVIDSAALEKMIGEDEELLADLAVMFVQFLPDVEGRLRVGLETRDHELIQSVFHQLRSRVSYFGATKIQLFAKSIEERAREQDFDGIDEDCENILRDIEELIVELREMTRLPLERCQEE